MDPRSNTQLFSELMSLRTKLHFFRDSARIEEAIDNLKKEGFYTFRDNDRLILLESDYFWLKLEADKRGMLKIAWGLMIPPGMEPKLEVKPEFKTKAEEIRHYLNKGMEVGAVASLLSIRYQQVYQVAKAMKLK